MEEISSLRKEIKEVRFMLLLAFVGTIAAFLILALVGGYLFLRPHPIPPANVHQTANPEIINNLSDPTETIESRGERQGYYTKAQFAQLMGFSVRTLERRIASNLLEPAPYITESGEVRIDLDATLTRH